MLQECKRSLLDSYRLTRFARTMPRTRALGKHSGNARETCALGKDSGCSGNAWGKCPEKCPDNARTTPGQCPDNARERALGKLGINF